jgi:hypothetical protein
MMLSLFFTVFWFIMAGANFVRPSALHRGYAILWIFTIGWLVLVAATVFEDRFKISGGYMFVFFESAMFLAAFISLCELFALPTKASVIEAARDAHEIRDRIDTLSNTDDLIARSSDEVDDGDATETTPLVGGDGHRSPIGATFANHYRRAVAAAYDGANDTSDEKHHAFGGEQKWSAKLPTWTWLLQFFLIGPFMLVILGQVGLLLCTATAQTGPDGSPLLLPYLIIAPILSLDFDSPGSFHAPHHSPYPYVSFLRLHRNAYL